MPIEFSTGQSSISELISGILAEVIDEAVEATLLEKVASYGVGVSDEAFALKFDVKSLRQYRVIPGFPKPSIIISFFNKKTIIQRTPHKTNEPGIKPTNTP